MTPRLDDGDVRATEAEMTQPNAPNRADRITERVMAELRVLYATSEVLLIGDRENVRHPVERAVRLAVPLALRFAEEDVQDG